MSMSPGSMLDGRYRLEVLLSEQDGARFWRATDTVLARSVAVHVVASTDPRAAAVLAAAQRSAGVTDPHFLRVLDCADADGLTWVINEWGDGASLDVMLVQGNLPPMRAAWLTREVAEAIAAAHAQGLSHGRLNPEAVLVTESGAVKIIGFMLNAAFERTGATPSPYGAISPREADVVDLAGILYAALTGRWPGVAPSGVKPAPRDGTHPLRPRQVRAGVPRTLDAICDRVLHKEASQHAMPIETAHEIAAALSDFVGDPAAVAPADVPSMHADPEAAELPALDETAVAAAPVPAVVAAPTTTPGPAPEPEPAAPTLTEIPGDDAPRPQARPANPPPAAVTPVVTASPPPSARPASRPEAGPGPGLPTAHDPDETMAAAAPYSPSGIELDAADSAPAAPPPPFEQPVARPLFAEQERRVPASAAAAPTAPPSARWPFEDEPAVAEHEGRPRRRGLRNVLIALVVIAVGAAMFLAFRAGKDDDGNDPSPGATSPSRTATSPSSSPSSTPSVTTPTGTPISIAAVGDFDPEGDPPSENPGRAARATDGNPDTYWPTETYKSAALGDLKSGVGLVVDLGEVRPVTSVEVSLDGGPTDLEVYASPAEAGNPPADLAGTNRLGGVNGSDGSAVLDLPAATRTRYVVVWLTKLPEQGDGFQGRIAEITVRS